MQGQPTASSSAAASAAAPAGTDPVTGAGLPHSPGLIARTVRRHWLAIALLWTIAAAGMALWQYHLLDLTLVGRRHLVLAASLAASCSLIVAAFARIEARSGLVTGPDEFTRRSGIPVLGVIAPLPRAGASTRRAAEEFTRGLDHLMVSFAYGRQPGGRDRRCVLVTSAIAGEGKTTLAAQLAGRCGNAGFTTLLIDGDLRRDALSRYLEVPSSPGLAEVLRGEVRAEEAISFVGDGAGFHVMAAGRRGGDVTRLLNGERLGELIGRLREGFDVILIDTPPVLLLCDALLLGRCTDGAVLVTLRGKSRLPLVERAARRLAHVGVPVLGAVINGDRPSGAACGGYVDYEGGEGVPDEG